MLHTLTDSQLLFHLSIGRITFLSFQEKIFLSKKLDNFDSLVLLSIEDIFKLLNKKFSDKVIWNGKENLHMAKIALHYCRLMKIEIVFHFDEEYPELLKQISDPPYLLFIRGNVNILNKKCVSVVGTRKLSQTGKKAACDFGYDAVFDCCNIISGLAHGADYYAHKGAIDAYFDCMEKGDNISDIGKTIAVIPSAIDEIVPYSNRRLAEQIIQSGGCLVSEYGPGISMAKWHFVARNRIIAGMSLATVVIEAPTGSGALITADFALDYNRDVMFHESAFNDIAVKICEDVHKNLEINYANGHISKYKMENTPLKYLEAGAPVIKDYKDYCVALKEVPGKRIKVPVQGELF